MIKDYIQKFKVADAADEWFGIDKAMHFNASFAIGVGCALVITSNPWAVFGISMIPGIVEEFIDAREGGSGFSYKDIVADAAGVLISIWILGFL